MKWHPWRLGDTGAICAASNLALALTPALAACAGSSTPMTSPSATATSTATTPGGRTSGPSGQPVLLWKFRTREFGISATPAVTGGVVCCRGNDGYLYATDAQSGKERWKLNVGTFGISSSPAVADGVVYFGSNGELYALDAQSGEVRWSFATGSEGSGTPGFSFPTVADGVVYVGGEDGYLYAVTAK